jgi:hypothetical protein
VGLGYGVLTALGVQGTDDDPTGQQVQGMLERILVGRHDD